MREELGFKLNQKDQFYITEVFLSNGHWLVSRKAWHEQLNPKRGPLKDLGKLMPLQTNRKFNGLKDTYATEINADRLHAIIPKRDGYRLFNAVQPTVKMEGLKIISYVFDVPADGDKEAFQIAVQPRYAQVLQMGHCFARDTMGPILVLSENTINAPDLFAVLMPMRMK